MIIKKNLLALAVTSAISLSAHAASVTLYGSLDAGYSFEHQKTTVADVPGAIKHNSAKLDEGLGTSNKIGLKGEEQLGSGATVGFKLENGFNLLNGSLANSGTLFSREARLYVNSSFGELSAGRFGGLNSATGSFNTFFANADAFDGGDKGVALGFVTSGVMDNSIAYRTPEIAGVQGTLMYSFNKSGAQQSKFNENDRYIGAGLTFKHNALTLVGTYEGELLSKTLRAQNKKNLQTFSLGGNYDFGAVKVFVGGQFAKNAKYSQLNQNINADDFVKLYAPVAGKSIEALYTKLSSEVHTNPEAFRQLQVLVVTAAGLAKKYKEDTGLDVVSDITNPAKMGENINRIFSNVGIMGPLFEESLNGANYKGYAFTLGAQIPVSYGLITVGTYFSHYKNTDRIIKNVLLNGFDYNHGNMKLTNVGLAARYEHALSQRTNLYVGATGNLAKEKDASGYNIKTTTGSVYFGMNHAF